MSKYHNLELFFVYEINNLTLVFSHPEKKNVFRHLHLNLFRLLTKFKFFQISNKRKNAT